ncbi:hypothetical protein D3C80_2182050 [compost metagenome]
MDKQVEELPPGVRKIRVILEMECTEEEDTYQTGELAAELLMQDMGNQAKLISAEDI